MSLNYFIFDGESSLNYGVYIGGQNTFNAPQRDVEKISIPGRNGDLIQDNGRFLNVQVPYNIVVMDEFKDKTDAIKAWLLSKKGYCKLVDTYHPGTYRMARVAGGIDFETSAYNLTGKTQIIFDCKPQRFLDSGDERFNVGSVSHTEWQTGSVVSFYGEEDETFRKIETELKPIQDLHGYGRPWPAGGGKNKAPQITAESTHRGITFTPNADGSIHAEGVTTESNWIYCTAGIVSLQSLGLAVGDNITLSVSSGHRIGIYYYDSGNTLISNVFATTSTTSIIPEGTVNVMVYFYPFAISTPGVGVEVNTDIYGMIEKGTSATTWEPYSNICPIYGRTAENVFLSGKNMLVNKVIAIIMDEDFLLTSSFDGKYSLNVVRNFTAAKVLIYDTAVANGGSANTQNRGEKTIPNGQYQAFFSGDVPSQIKIQVCCSNNPSGNDGIAVVFDANNGVFTIDDSYAYNWIRILGATNMPVGQYDLRPMILRHDETDLSWEKNTRTEYPVSWQAEAGTVYSGTIDVVSGILTVDMVYKSLATMDWKLFSAASKPVFYADNSDGRTFGAGEISGLLCDMYRTNPTAINAVPFVNLGFDPACSQAQNYTGRIMIIDTRFDTLEDFKAGVSGNVVYQLATPQTYQLDEHEIAVLLGANNVWSDSGIITAEWSPNPNIIRNPTRFASKPEMEITGVGNGTVTVGDDTILISNLNGNIIIDSELMNCYDYSQNRNADVVLPNHEYPELQPGGNYISFSGGITKVLVQGRWWTI